ncbi:MAG TPA: hypothetical protein PK605_03955 [Ignavibacteria bacterium]|nr:hypothetical protein [Ignavibacteria bacterium]HRF64675.1 hypothetical protein [Ignavibacteria bacterium]HRJ03540.1 hypothetical protein [Ignavibacteria bacterium]HRJ84124.1 hypothetical protein [Ignavibacteria bacterium]
MKKLVSLILLMFSANLFAQNNLLTEGSFANYNSLSDSLPVIPLIFAGSEKNPYFVDSLHYFESIDSVESFMKFKKLNGPVEGSWDSDNHALLLAAYRGGDCLAKFEIDLFDNTDTKEYIFTVKIIYGGCRAGGKSYLNWYRIPKLPYGYQLKYRTYHVDREF